jgi:plastocyanin
MTTGLLRGIFLLLTGWLFFSGQSHAADYYIGVNGFGFSPSTQTIEVGDTVIWVNNDEFSSHTTTSDLSGSNPNYWNSLLVNQDDTFAHIFNNVGTFTYHDTFENTSGTIIVNSPSVTPTITLESPRLTNGQFLFAATGLTVGKSCVLMVSTNLTSWTGIKTNVAAGSSLTFTNATVSGSRFFQVVEQP